MAHILLVQFDNPLGDEITRLLRQLGHQVHIAPITRLTDSLLKSTPAFDVVVMDVSVDDDVRRRNVKFIADYRNRRGGSPGLLCVSRVYRGARFEFDLEKKGARVVYV